MPDSILLQGCEEAMLEQRRRLHVAHAGVAVCVCLIGCACGGAGGSNNRSHLFTKRFPSGLDLCVCV